jgi:predicted DNA-binding transcriptional regulator AlpA
MSEHNKELDRLLKVGEAAELLSCSVSSLNKWRITGNGPRFVYIGNRIRYRTSEIAAYINRRTRASTSASEAPAV